MEREEFEVEETVVRGHFTNVFEKIEEQWGEEVKFLQKLGQYESTLGNEAGIQHYIARFLKEEMAMDVDVFDIDHDEIATHKGYSLAEWSYEGRPNVVGKLSADGPKEGKSLILQGHVDVVPVNSLEMWNYHPWSSTIKGNKMYGRGIQDMKSGIAAMIYALKAIKAAGITLAADVFVQSVIEEECTGNGALATLMRGYEADGVLIPEPFGQTALLSQVGVIWMRVKVKGSGAHVERADRAINAIEKSMVIMNAIQEYREYINKQPKHENFKDHPNPLNINIGKIQSGDWPSNVPSECTFEVRIGLYPGIDPQKVKDEVKDWIFKKCEQDPWLTEVPPELSFYGFHAEGVALDKEMELFKTLEHAHQKITGNKLVYASITATTDIRFYNLYYGIPATCYGPKGDSMHGIDEWVDLDSVKEVTKIYAAFILEWCKVK